MKIATTTGDFSRFCQTDEEKIRELHRAGFRYIDLDMTLSRPIARICKIIGKNTYII
jgi:hypothetical protein